MFRALTHTGKLPALEIERKTAVIRTAVAARERLPRKVIRFIWMDIDQAKQPIMEHFVQRRALSQQITLLGRNAQTEQKRRRSGQPARQRRMEYAIETDESANATLRIDVTKERSQVNAADLRNKMSHADETAEHTGLVHPAQH